MTADPVPPLLPRMYPGMEWTGVGADDRGRRMYRTRCRTLYARVDGPWTNVFDARTQAYVTLDADGTVLMT